MRRHGRFFQQDILTHCYQRTQDGGLIFYAYSDYLVWFTVLCTEARKRDVQILALCPMPDHVHLSVTASCQEQFSGFMGEYSRRFSRARNQALGLSGELFQHSFGSAVKTGAKKARTNLIYVGNNPVERQLASQAEQYRWTFLAYASSDHPFSEKLVLRRASRALQGAIREVSAQFKMGKPLSYMLLRRLFSPLSNEERQQLTDFIIVTYNVIDYDAALRYFDNSLENMLTAMHSTTGSEYDLNEPFCGKSDLPYLKMNTLIRQHLQLDDIHEILRFNDDDKLNAFRLLRRQGHFDPRQIAKFLHLEKW